MGYERFFIKFLRFFSNFLVLNPLSLGPDSDPYQSSVWIRNKYFKKWIRIRNTGDGNNF